MDPTQRAALLATLETHAPADEPEATDLSRIRALIRESDSPTSRAQFAPGHLTASAVLIDPGLTKTLLIKHRKLGLWLQPGGHFEPGELAPDEVALREVQEETGLAGKVLRLLDVDVHEIPARKDEPAHEHFDLRFLVEVPAEGEIVGDGADAVRWLTPVELEGFDLDPGLRRALGKVAWA